MRALAAGMDSGRVPAQLCAVVSSSAHCAGAQWARDRGVPVILYPPTPALLASSHELEGVARLSGSGDAVARSPQELVELLRTLHGASIVCLAGYLKLVPAELVRAFPKAMLNIHPSLLPAFGGAGMYGARVHRAVVARGARVSGATVHFVSEEFDEGAILAQAAVPVYPADAPADVAARVLQQEHQLFPTCLAALAGGSVVWRPDGVPYIKDEG